MTKDGKLGVALIGACAGICRSAFIPALQQNQQVKVTVAMDLSPDLKEVADGLGCDYTNNAEDAVNREDVDIVCITSPDDRHLEHTRLALGANKHTICTKPLALTLSEAYLMRTAAANSKALFMCGMNMRYTNWSSHIKQMIGDGEIGKPVYVSFRIKGDYFNYPADSFYRKAASGGQVVHNGAHFLDVMSFWADSLPVSVYGVSTSCEAPGEDKVEFDNYHNLNLEFESGAIGMLEYNQLLVNPRGYPTLYSMMVVGVEGMIEYCVTEKRAVEIYSNGKLNYPPLPSKNAVGTYPMVNEFVKAVLSGGKSPIPIEHSIRILETCIIGLESCKTGKKLRIEEVEGV